VSSSAPVTDVTQRPPLSGRGSIAVIFEIAAAIVGVVAARRLRREWPWLAGVAVALLLAGLVWLLSAALPRLRHPRLLRAEPRLRAHAQFGELAFVAALGR